MRTSTITRAPDQSATVVTVASGGPSQRSKALVALFTALLLLVGWIALSLTNALPTFGARAQTIATGEAQTAPGSAQGRLGTGTSVAGSSQLPADVVRAEWDGPAINLDWRGAEYARAETTFVGERTASPGDRVTRTLNVTNAGPGDGIAAVTVDVAEIVPDGALNSGLADDVTLFWSIGGGSAGSAEAAGSATGNTGHTGVSGNERFSALVNTGRIVVAEISVAQGATVPVTFGFEMGRDVTTSNSLGAPSTELSFDVGVNLTGELDKPSLSVTGGSTALIVAAIAAALLILGILVFALRRRRGSDEAAQIHSKRVTDSQ